MTLQRMRADNRDPIYTVEQVDQLILTPEARSTLMVSKKPKYEKVPIYAKDDKGNKIPMLDDQGANIVDAEGTQRYLIKDHEYVQRGWMPVMEAIPASELFTIDHSTSNISSDAVRLTTFLMWNYNHILSLQAATDDDYSVLLHKIRNDIVAILSAAKSYNGGTIASIKTFRQVNDSKQWLHSDEPQQGNSNPLSMIFGGNKKAPPQQEDSKKYTAFQ